MINILVKNFNSVVYGSNNFKEVDMRYGLLNYKL